MEKIKELDGIESMVFEMIHPEKEEKGLGYYANLFTGFGLMVVLSPLILVAFIYVLLSKEEGKD